jgi:Fe-S cluster biogenesis protein NfuA
MLTDPQNNAWFYMSCRLYLISPPKLSAANFLVPLREALAGGDVASFQLRLKHVSDDEIRRAVDTLRPAVQAKGAAFILNDRPDLAAELFEITGVTRVFYGPDFITVGKHEAVDWPLLKAPILAAIMDHFTSGQPLFADADDSEAGGHDEGVYEGETAQIVAEIKDLLDTRIRPAVAQDGGDILFNRFEPATGVVWLHMRGACSGCPSSSATLKAGVENMLKHYVPEVTRVEQTL